MPLVGMSVWLDNRIIEGMMEQITDLYGNDDIEAMYQAALAMPLDTKIEQSVTLIRSRSEEHTSELQSR
jgi:hypothetical protein